MPPSTIPFNPLILREYDIRGVVGESLGPQIMTALGIAFAQRVVASGGRRIAVGRDGRLSSPALEAALVSGLASQPVEVVTIGTGPTPMLYFAGLHLAADGAIMVTGSHNPPDHNGLKMVLGGKPFFGADIQALGQAAIAAHRALPDTGAMAAVGRVTACDIRSAYLARMLQGLRFGRPLRIVWDPGNGAAGAVLPELVAKLPGWHRLINAEVDGRFPNHHPDPTMPENMVQLREAVRAERADLGIAFDGDGDRVGILDQDGNILFGDQYIALLARQVLRERPGATIIVDVKTSDLVAEEIARLGGQCLIYKTGHSLIKTKMKEINAPFAGEMSGHIFFADRYLGFDDGLYAALRFVEFLSAQDSDLASLCAALPKRVSTPETRVDCPDEKKFELVEILRARLKAQGRDYLGIDGARVNTPDGWWLVRASNTQPILVTRAEARDATGLARVQAELTAQLRQCFAEAGLAMGRSAGH